MRLYVDTFPHLRASCLLPYILQKKFKLIIYRRFCPKSSLYLIFFCKLKAVPRIFDNFWNILNHCDVRWHFQSSPLSNSEERLSFLSFSSSPIVNKHSMVTKKQHFLRYWLRANIDKTHTHTGKKVDVWREKKLRLNLCGFLLNKKR